MTKRKILSCLTVLIIGIGPFVLIGYFYLTTGIVVCVVNNSPNVLKNINIAYYGGFIFIEKLDPNTSFRKHINPDSESGLDFTWLDNNGKEHFLSGEVYIEHNYRGSVTMTIDPEGKSSVKHSWKY
jgi:hypothetical protein